MEVKLQSLCLLVIGVFKLKETAFLFIIRLTLHLPNIALGQRNLVQIWGPKIEPRPQGQPLH